MEKVSSESKKSKIRKSLAVTAFGAVAVLGGGVLLAGCNPDNVKSAYDIAVENGFEGTEVQWLESLKGKSAYDLAVEAGYTGTQAEWLASLQGTPGQAPTVSISQTTGNWLINGQDSGISALGSTGSTGKSAYQIAVENGFEGTEQEWLDSLKGQDGSNGANGSQGAPGPQGVGIADVDVDIVYRGLDTYYQFTITYTDPSVEPTVILAPVPKVVSYIDVGSTQYYAMVSSTADAPEITMNVTYQDYTYETIVVTEDMYVIDSDLGYEKPDFTTQGVYNTCISFRGQQVTSTIYVYDEAQSTCTQVGGFATVRVGEGSLADVSCSAEYSNDTIGTFYKPITLTDEMVTAGTDTLNWDARGRYILQISYNGVPGFVMIDVYDPKECNISNIEIYDDETLYFPSTFSVAVGADINEYVNANIVGKYAELRLYEPTGEEETTVIITSDMVDVSKIDTSKAGEQSFIIKYTLPGNSAEYTEYFNITVAYDLSEKEPTKSGDIAEGSIFASSNVTSFGIYENVGASNNETVVVLSYSDGTFAQYTAELVNSDSDSTPDIVKMYDFDLGGYGFFALESTTQGEPETTTYTLADYAPAGEVKTTLSHTVTSENFTMPISIDVYSESEFTLGETTGEFYAVVSTNLPGLEAQQKLAVIQVTFETQSDSSNTFTVSALGQTYTINTESGNTLSPYVPAE